MEVKQTWGILFGLNMTESSVSSVYVSVYECVIVCVCEYVYVGMCDGKVESSWTHLYS